MKKDQTRNYTVCAHASKWKETEVRDATASVHSSVTVNVRALNIIDALTEAEKEFPEEFVWTITSVRLNEPVYGRYNTANYHDRIMIDTDE